MSAKRSTSSKRNKSTLGRRSSSNRGLPITNSSEWWLGSAGCRNQLQAALSEDCKQLFPETVSSFSRSLATPFPEDFYRGATFANDCKQLFQKVFLEECITVPENLLGPIEYFTGVQRKLTSRVD